MKNIEEILFEEFKVVPTLSEFVRYILDNTDLFRDKKEFNIDELNEINAKELDLIGSFLKLTEDTSLELEMLVLCDKNGNLLEEPKEWEAYVSNGYMLPFNIDNCVEKCKQYKEAQERVLFDGFEINEITNTDVIFKNGMYWQFFLQKLGCKTKWKPKISDMVGQKVTINFWKLLSNDIK